MRRITGKICRNSETSCVALAQAVFQHKESLVLIRSLKRGLMLHFLFLKNEIRDERGVKAPSRLDRENVFGGLRARALRRRITASAHSL